MSNLAGTSDVSIETATQTLLAVAVNTIVKAGIVFLFGSLALFRRILILILSGLGIGLGIFS